MIGTDDASGSATVPDRTMLIEDFRTHFGSRADVSEAVIRHHSEDEGYRRHRPDLVFAPRDTEEIQHALAICDRHACPVTPWGAGTSLEGNALAVNGGVSLDMSEMNRILEIRPGDFSATVEAGVRRKQLNTDLRDTGLFFPVDPGADATIGGMASTRASGTNAVRYGTMRDNVLSCTAVLANGQIIRTGTAAAKSAAGYDLTALLVGSEGTLGIITELRIRLSPIPECAVAFVCTFPNVAAAIAASVAIIQAGFDIARIELLDGPMMSAINAYGGNSYATLPTLFIEAHGCAELVDVVLDQTTGLIIGEGGEVVFTGSTPGERSRLWKARHDALYATRALRPGAKVMITDVCVPISNLAQCIEQTRKDLEQSHLVATIAGHVGDGNFHAFIVVDPSNEQEIAAAEQLHHRIGGLAIELGGTCTGEHGIGSGKIDLLARQSGPALSVMTAIKRTLDPKGLLNPGKVFIH